MTAAPDGKKRTDSIVQSGFPKLFEAAFANWTRGRDPSDVDKAFMREAKISATTADSKDVAKTVSNWRKGKSTPKNVDVWNAAREVLLQAPDNHAIIEELDAAYQRARGSRQSGGNVPAAPWKPGPDEPRPIADRAGVGGATASPPKASLAGGVAAAGAPIVSPTRRSTTATGSLTERTSESRFEKLAYVSLDDPPQGSKPQDFELIVDIGFGWTPYPDSATAARVALRRVVVLPTLQGCQMLGATRFGADGKADGVRVRAKQWEIAAKPDEVLEGAPMGAQHHLVTLKGDGSAAEVAPSVEVELQCEWWTDIKVELLGQTACTQTEKKLAEKFLAKLLAQAAAGGKSRPARLDKAVTLAKARLAWKQP